MKDKNLIIIGLVIFLILMTSPVWYNIISGEPTASPETIIETANEPGRDKCVMPADYMRTDHMDLLDEWRDLVVREGVRVHKASHTGKKFNMSLTNTCMDCHSNKDTFCDRCHNYAGVDPYCWTCHIEPGEVQ
ncbi:MAG: sulfate reduction electron transfer complex DsrMKJOP subunit DsrJ [Candidatus Electryoneaceae bacterium]|nr:sulfate reduction electron transfer complex DsrMKJOP subunit DsrJ [Candidatus Electryoneaceae bacterium]